MEQYGYLLEYIYLFIYEKPTTKGSLICEYIKNPEPKVLWFVSILEITEPGVNFLQIWEPPPTLLQTSALGADG